MSLGHYVIRMGRWERCARLDRLDRCIREIAASSHYIAKKNYGKGLLAMTLLRR